MWILTGIISVLMTCCTFLWLLKDNRKKYYSAVIAISLMAITLLLKYYQVYNWVLKKDWSALMDVVPTMFGALSIYAIIIILLNLIAVSIKKR